MEGFHTDENQSYLLIIAIVYGLNLVKKPPIALIYKNKVGE